MRCRKGRCCVVAATAARPCGRAPGRAAFPRPDAWRARRASRCRCPASAARATAGRPPPCPARRGGCRRGRSRTSRTGAAGSRRQRGRWPGQGATIPAERGSFRRSRSPPRSRAARGQGMERARLSVLQACRRRYADNAARGACRFRTHEHDASKQVHRGRRRGCRRQLLRRDAGPCRPPRHPHRPRRPRAAIDRRACAWTRAARVEIVRLAASADRQRAGRRLVLFCVKSTDTDAWRARWRRISPSAVVMSLQNGVENAPTIARHVR